MRIRISRSRLTAAGRFLLVVGIAMTLLLGFNAARLSVEGTRHAYAATQTISTTQVQWDLAGLGYLPWSGIDGVYGPQTTAAVKSFQSNVCISVDGVAGPQTDSSLGMVVQEVQAKVGASQDGLFGPQTKADVQSYQQAHGLTVDGQAGPITMRAMGITRVHSCGSAPPPPTAAPRPPSSAPPAPAAPALPPVPNPTTASTPGPPNSTPPGHAGSSPGNGGAQSGNGGSGSDSGTGGSGSGGNPATGPDPGVRPLSTPAKPAPTQTCVPLLLPEVAPALQPCIPVASPSPHGPAGLAATTNGGGTGGAGTGSAQSGRGQNSGPGASSSGSRPGAGSGASADGSGASSSGSAGSSTAAGSGGSSGSPQATAQSEISLVASSGDGLAWPAVLGGIALGFGLALLLLARRTPDGTRRPHK